MLTHTARLRAYTHDRGGFSGVTGENVLLYWPHGFGDWVQFSLVLPLLDKSNRYWMTRFGDDSVTLIAGHPVVTPVYLGVGSPHCEDGGAFGVKHFGLEYDGIAGREVELRVPLSLHDVIVREKIGTMLWSWYPETHGTVPAPYHTKARNMARHLTRELPEAFEAPLRGSLCLDVDPVLRQLVEARLRNLCGFGVRRLCLIGRGGYTSVGKNWGNLWREDLPEDRRKQGQECRDFIETMLAKSEGWCFLLMEDRAFADSLKDPSINTFAYADLFGDPEHAVAPFGQVMRCLVKLAGLCVGVPAGPYHFAAQVESLPTIGVWLEHLPSWYDEPRDGLVHVIGSIPARQLEDEARPGSFLEAGPFRYKAILPGSRTVPGAAVMAAAESVLGAKDWSAPGTTYALPKPRSRYAEWHDKVDRLLENAPETAPDELTGKGKGIVMCGGGRYWPSAWVAIRRLRASGCTLPVQLWHLGAAEMGPADRSLAAALGVVCVDAFEVRQRAPSRILNGWELKPYAVIHSPFAEVLFLDADNVVVRDPTYLFQSPAYVRQGSLFWPDRGCLAKEREIWSICRVPYRHEPEFDSGQMLIDKGRCWRPLQLAMHFNEYSDFYYKHTFGDKDTYRFAWHFLGREYGMIPHRLRHVDDVFHQHDEGGEKVFQHGVKWHLSQGHRYRREYLFQDECMGFLDELAAVARAAAGRAPAAEHATIAGAEMAGTAMADAGAAG